MKFVPPRKGLRHVLRVIREALYYQPEGKGTDIAGALEYLNRVTKRRTITFIISDFLATGFKRLLAVANKRHDIVAVTITDPREIDLPNVGILKLEDAESGASFVIDTGEANFRKRYKADSLQMVKQRERLLRATNVDNIDVRTDVPYARELIKFFRMRERKLA